MKSAIIFGASGQDGFYLTKLLENLGIKIYGTASAQNKKFTYVDLAVFPVVKKFIFDITPDYIFFLSAISSTTHDSGIINHDIISTGTINILEACKQIDFTGKIFIAGSALQYKPSNKPLSEKSQYDNKTLYACSRNYSTNISRYYREKFNLMIYIGFLFHHDSPHRDSKHLSSQIISSALSIKNDEIKTIKIQDINYVKEFNHAEDIVKAIWALVNQNKIFELNIGSGISYSIKNFITEVFDYLNLNWKNYVKYENITKTDNSYHISNPGLIQSLGWEPKHNLKSLIIDMIKNGNFS